MPLVLSNTKKRLMPCTPKRARLLLERGRAAVFRLHPFTIILKDRSDGEIQPIEVKVDPGSKTSGMALVVHGEKGKKVVWAGNLDHRGQTIKKSLEKRRAIRRFRRSRHTRHRKARFLNRRRPKGWLAPCLKSRVQNIETLTKRLAAFTPITQAAVETVRFDTQKLQNPEILGTQYQQGELFGYEVREYLLEKYQRTCVYCDKKNVPLQVEHVIPKSKGGSNRVSNLVIGCGPCNQKKGSMDLNSFLEKDSTRRIEIAKSLKLPLVHTAAVNSTRNAVAQVFQDLFPNTQLATGGQTKFNRISQGLEKDHWIDAVCVGDSGEKVMIPTHFKPRRIKATGHGDRQAVLMNKFGFPRSKPATTVPVQGFQTGDIVKAKVPSGKKAGNYEGRVAVRNTVYFNITTKAGVVQGISHKHCQLIHRKDGYAYF